MTKITQIIWKNLKLVLRSKTSALIVVFGPLIMILLVGLAFNNSSKYNINIGVYADDYSDLTNSFIEKLKEQSYNVILYDNEELCTQNIKLGNTHTCIIFPPDLEIVEGKENNIVFYIDYSKVNLAWMIKDSLTSQVQQRSSELTLDMTSNIIEKLQYAEDEIINYTSDLDQLLIEKDSIATFGDSVNEALDELDLGFDKSKFKVDDVKSTFTTIMSKIHSIVKKTTVALGEAEDEIITAIDNTYDADINDSEEDRIIDALEEALDEVNNSMRLVAEADNISTFQEINIMMSDISDNLDSVSNKLVKAGEGHAKVKTKIESIKKLVESSKTRINKVKEANDRIIVNIRGISVDDASTIVSPITTTIKTVVPEKTHLNYMIPALIVMIIMFMSILFSSTLVMMEKHSKAFFRNFVTPTSSVTFVLGTFFTSMVLLIVQSLIIGIIYYGFFLKEFSSTIGLAGFIILLIIAIFTLIGMFIGYFFNSEETSTLASICVGSLFLFMSNIILPLESMPEYIFKIARFNPFLIAEDTLKKILLFNQSFDTLYFEVGMLVLYSIVLLVLIVGMQSFVKRSFMYHYAFKIMFRKPVHDPLITDPRVLREKKAKDPFILAKGKQVTTLFGLMKELEKISDGEFNNHVTSKKHAIADWIKTSLGLPGLSIKIRKAQKRKKLIAVLQKYVK